MKDYIAIIKSNLFDNSYYREQYEDVKKSGLDPLYHFVIYGWKEGRNPCECFNTCYYLKIHSDVAENGINPMVHYIKYGYLENRQTHPYKSIMIDNNVTYLSIVLSLLVFLQNSISIVFYKISKASVLRFLVNKEYFFENEQRELIFSYHDEQTDSQIPAKEYNNSGIKDLQELDIDKYECIILDVFDTSVIRLFLQPTDLFFYISYLKDDKKFYDRRIRKEKHARKMHNYKKEVTIDDIYREMNCSDLLESEIETELKYCVANPEIFEFYLKAIEAGKKVVFISDMYLDKTTIAGILNNCGYSTYENLFVSSEDNLIKGDGTRYEWLKANWPAYCQGAVMIGDNYVADYAQARKHGFDAFHYSAVRKFYKDDQFLSNKYDFFLEGYSLGLSFILSMFRYWKLSIKEDALTYWKQFGFLYGGALVAAFCQYIHDNLREEDCENQRLFFLGRDGDILLQAYNHLFDDNRAKLLHVSRRCVIFPAIKSFDYSVDENELKHFVMPIELDSEIDFLHRIGYYDIDELNYDLKSIDYDKIGTLRAELLHVLYENRLGLLKRVESERINLFHYMQQNNVFEPEQIVLIDVGWAGTIQDSLTKLFAMWGFSSKQINGIYIGANDKCNSDKNKAGYLFNNNQTKEHLFAEYKELIELISSSPLEPITHIEEKEGMYVPANNGISIHEKIRLEVAKDIQQGIKDFVSIVKEQNIHLNFIRPNDYEFLFKTLKKQPSSQDLYYLNSIRHSALVNGKYSKPVLNFDYISKQNTLNITIAVVYITNKFFNNFYVNNERLRGYSLIGVDNRKNNQSLTVIYNKIIDAHIDTNSWLVFAHEDLLFLDDLSVISGLNPKCLYGSFGVRLENNFLPVGYGNHICSNKDGSDATEVGISIDKPAKVDTLDCQCIVVHTTLLQEYPELRFDENLSFHLYVEDFCILANSKYGISSKVLPLRFQHFSFGQMDDEYYKSLEYLDNKYPAAALPGPCSFIGGKAELLSKKYTYDIKAKK
jgi:predicted HAD superfamily hydrolase